MNYIILDLEWDSVYVKHIGGFMNQILQIGAVKLNESFDVIDVFDVVIKSSVSKRLTRRFVELTGITKEEMLEQYGIKAKKRAWEFSQGAYIEEIENLI